MLIREWSKEIFRIYKAKKRGNKIKADFYGNRKKYDLQCKKSRTNWKNLPLFGKFVIFINILITEFERTNSNSTRWLCFQGQPPVNISSKVWTLLDGSWNQKLKNLRPKNKTETKRQGSIFISEPDPKPINVDSFYSSYHRWPRTRKSKAYNWKNLSKLEMTNYGWMELKH